MNLKGNINLKFNDNIIILFGKGINIIEFDKKNNNLVDICQLNNISKTKRYIFIIICSSVV